jgi:hypothetical protein
MKKLGILLIIISIVISSCKKVDNFKNGINISNAKVTVNQKLVYKKPTTPDEIQLVENLKKITSILKELYKKPNNLRLVDAAIFSKVFRDESVLLKDLIYPEAGVLSTDQRFINSAKKWNVDLTNFNNNFWKEVNKMGDPTFTTFLQSLKPNDEEYSGLIRNMKSTKTYSYQDISIYFPYSENFTTQVNFIQSDPDKPQITTIASATEDADEGIGFAPYLDMDGIVQYKDILVNDDYAYNNPTQIIGINSIEPYDFVTTPSTYSYFPPSDSIDLPNFNIGRSVHMVFIGDVRCTHQYDHLISFTGNGGGSEIKFTRSDGYLKLADGQVQADNFLVDGPPISRKNIRQHNWIEWALQWDGDWEADNKEQFFAIYEDDNRNTSTLTASLKTTLKFDSILTGEGTIGVSLIYKSDDAIIRQTNLKYSSFFALNRVDLEGEMHNGWPVYDKNGSVSYTLWDKTIY